MTATVTGSGPTPTGTASFTVNGSPVLCNGTATVASLSGGVAPCKWTPSAAGSYTVATSYSGDVNYAAAGPSANYTLTVDGSITTTIAKPVLVSPTPPAAYQTPITVSTVVTPASGPAPTGSVSFTATVNATPTVVCPAATLDDTGTASCTFTPGFSADTGGTASITAKYLGSSTNAPSATSTALAVVVLGGNTLSSFTIGTSANPAASAAAVTLTATLAGPAGAPTGTVAFSDNGVAIAACGADKLTSGAASCHYTPSAPGRTPSRRPTPAT